MTLCLALAFTSKLYWDGYLLPKFICACHYPLRSVYFEVIVSEFSDALQQVHSMRPCDRFSGQTVLPMSGNYNLLLHAKFITAFEHTLLHGCIRLQRLLLPYILFSFQFSSLLLFNVKFSADPYFSFDKYRVCTFILFFTLLHLLCI